MTSPLNTVLVFDAFGDVDDLRLTTAPAPIPGTNEIRVRVNVAGLNPVDWQIIESAELAAHFGVSAPGGYGNDFAGVVDAVGDGVTRWQVGERVYGGARGRAAATFLIARADDPRIHHTPDEVSDLIAGVIDIVGRTASAVADRLALGGQDTVLIGSAAGGVGVILTQLAVASGARVLGTGSAGSLEFIASLGAEPVVYGSGLPAAVRALAPRGITAAADLYGLETATAALLLGAPAGRVFTIEADDAPEGITIVNGSDARPDALGQLLALVASGAMQIPIEQTYPLADFRAAVERQRERHTRGKLAFVLSNG